MSFPFSFTTSEKSLLVDELPRAAKTGGFGLGQRRNCVCCPISTMGTGKAKE